MDLGQIGAAALYGAVGGGGGALLGALLAAPFRKMKAGKTISMVLTVVGVVLGVNLAKPLLSPYIGKYIGDTPEARMAQTDAQMDEALAEFRKDPLFSALLAREPELEADFKQKLAAIVASARNPAEARRQAFSLSYNAVGDRLVGYLQRGQDGDILGYFDTMIDIIGGLAETDPEFCHTYLYVPAELSAMDLPAIVSKLGEDGYKRQQQAGAAVVTNAYDEIPEYDAQTAQLQLNMAGQYLFDTLGEEKIGLITAGQKPAGPNDARVACEASAGMMSMIRSGDMPAATFRHMMILSSQG